MPSLADVNINEITEMWHFTFTIALHEGQPSTFHYFGPELIHVLGEDYTGHEVEEAMDGLMGNLIGFYPKVIKQRSPVSESSHFYMEGQEARYRSLIVPLSSDGEVIDFLVGTTNYRIYE